MMQYLTSPEGYEKIYTGYSHTCVLDAEGNATCWANYSGQTDAKHLRSVRLALQ